MLTYLQIWQIADRENRGFLTPAGFGIVLRLIGHAQSGREPTEELALQRAPLPRFDGIQLPVASPSPLQQQGTGTGPIRIPSLTQDKVAQYSSLFDRQNPQNGFLAGEQARQIFDKSGLPNETLGRIWALSDTEQRGALSQAEFVISMHLLTCTKAGTLRGLPSVLPPGLLEAASGRANAGSPRGNPATAIPRQLSGMAQNRTGSPLSRSVGPSDWAITPADKAKFDQLYADLDPANKGFITGEEAVPFLSKSKLSEENLAQVWDLADISSSGQLNKDEFAVAMYLIRLNRLGSPLPATLPPNLIPPSMRNQSRQPPTSAFAPPPIKQAPAAQPKSALDDLFGLDSALPNPAPLAQLPMSTGGSASDPFAGGTPTSPVRAATIGPGSSFKPFVPTSSFGRSLNADGSGTPQSASDDLLADHDPEATKKLTGESTELANLSNQIGSLSKEMQDVQGKRTVIQTELNQTNTSKQNFEQRLAQLRQLYEKEAKDTQALEEQLRKSRSDTQKLQGECLTLEGTYQDVKQQHDQLSAALQADQQENANLRERIRVANSEISALKPTIEKLKMEARQQKGLVAINKKQLSTTEGERDKLKSESEELSKGGAVAEESSRHVEANTPEATTPSRGASPALSTSSANNPFFRRTTSTDILGVFPPPQSKTDKSVEDMFGPAGESAAGNASLDTAASTPVVSRQATLQTDQPPAPPESRQISSSFLPFPDQDTSLSSSRQVSPPASRVGESTGPAVDSTLKAETSEKAVAAESDVKGDADQTKSDDPFGQDDGAKAKADFDNAFAAFTSAKGQSAAATSSDKSKSAFDSEFPPISELEQDDDDDSDSESEQTGFDDDFAPADGDAKSKSTPVKQEPVAESKADEAVTPTAKDAVKPTEKSTDAAATTEADAKDASIDDIFGAAAPAANSSKVTFDDDDDDFDGLEEAKEGSADDDFANISRSGLEDYNNVFDSSPRGKSDTTAFGNESTFDFVNTGASQSKASESHDWDAIFSGLDSTDNALEEKSKPSDASESRPAGPGRALTDKGEHDDPILKNLTGMGYNRKDAVAALEKYDYNLERVSCRIDNPVDIDYANNIIGCKLPCQPIIEGDAMRR